MTASSGLLLFSCRATPLALARHAQLGTARAGVPLDFLRRRKQRLAGDKIEYRLLSAHAHRNVRRAGASVRECREDVLHDAVFQRVVADHRDDAARIEPADRRIKAATQNGQLRVDFNPKGLEGALGGMSPRAPRRGGYGRLDHIDQLTTLGYRSVRPRLR